jgi:hypothetical protein
MDRTEGLPRPVLDEIATLHRDADIFSRSFTGELNHRGYPGQVVVKMYSPFDLGVDFVGYEIEYTAGRPPVEVVRAFSQTVNRYAARKEGHLAAFYMTLFPQSCATR